MINKRQNLQTVTAELIDTQWDVNDVCEAVTLACKLELIDTQWDVNIFEVNNSSWLCSELIDTQWDVNMYTAMKNM